MILTCPECATRYFVPDEKVGPNGRTVRCSSCGNRWTAAGQSDLELFVDPEAGADARELTPEETPVSALPGDELPKVFRQKATTERRVREAATTGVVWAGLAVGLIAIMGAGWVFRGSVVELWPSAAGAYASVGVKVNRIGLEIEDVRAEAALQDGHAALAVSGSMRNVEDHPVEAPPLRISLINKSGKVVAVKIASPGDRLIPPGETRHFATAVLDPPTTASILEVGFDLSATAKHEARPSAHPPEEPKRVSLRGSEMPEVPSGPPVEATPVEDAAAEVH